MTAPARSGPAEGGLLRRRDQHEWRPARGATPAIATRPSVSLWFGRYDPDPTASTGTATSLRRIGGRVQGGS
jgi:hypothetical protein